MLGKEEGPVILSVPGRMKKWNFKNSSLTIQETTSSLRSIEHDILQQMEELKAHREFGFTSLYDYARKKLKLSEDIATTLIRLVRKSKEVPLLKEKIQSREIQISNAKVLLFAMRITKISTTKNKN